MSNDCCSSHYVLAKEALKSGKHIYVEKPFTDNVKGAEELSELASKNAFAESILEIGI